MANATIATVRGDEPTTFRFSPRQIGTMIAVGVSCVTLGTTFTGAIERLVTTEQRSIANAERQREFEQRTDERMRDFEARTVVALEKVASQGEKLEAGMQEQARTLASICARLEGCAK
jgi:hypothetical protein